LQAIGLALAYIHKVHGSNVIASVEFAIQEAATNEAQELSESGQSQSDEKKEDTSDGTTEEESGKSCLEQNLMRMARVRDSMLDIMVERTHDVNSFTRAAVLKVWSNLLESRSIPSKR